MPDSPVVAVLAHALALHDRWCGHRAGSPCHGSFDQARRAWKALTHADLDAAESLTAAAALLESKQAGFVHDATDALRQALGYAACQEPARALVAEAVRTLDGLDHLSAGVHDHDRMLAHLVDEWGALGVAYKLLEGVPPEDREKWVARLAVGRERGFVDVGPIDSDWSLPAPVPGRPGGWRSGAPIPDRDTLRGVIKAAYEALCAVGPRVGPLAFADEDARAATACIGQALASIDRAVAALGLDRGDTFAEPEPTPPATAHDRVLLRDLVIAANRMRDGWSEGDEQVKNRLWRNLHAAAEAAEDRVYPLDLAGDLPQPGEPTVDLLAPSPWALDGGPRLGSPCCGAGNFGDDHACEKQDGAREAEPEPEPVWSLRRIFDTLDRLAVLGDEDASRERQTAKRMLLWHAEHEDAVTTTVAAEHPEPETGIPLLLAVLHRLWPDDERLALVHAPDSDRPYGWQVWSGGRLAASGGTMIGHGADAEYAVLDALQTAARAVLRRSGE